MKKIPSTKKGWANLFRAAAGHIEKHGWAQGRYGTKSTGFCLLGAFQAAVGEPIDSQVDSIMTINGTLPEEFQTADEFNDHLGGHLGLGVYYPETTEKDVLKALRKTARLLEHGGPLP